tara:strand:+ start:5599 stop:6300 length:702 start_codon:yes stop_codon:yes gene_type:complete
VNQENVFLNGEGDAWFQRNHKANEPPVINHSRRMLGNWIEENCKNIKNILEIGAGSGYPLAYLAELCKSKGIGIEPSSQAIKCWREREYMKSTDVELIKGVASNLPFETSTFDMVGFGFCLYLIDRADIYRAMIEADRVLRTGGYMYIEDFDPISKYKNRYRHKEGLISYKEKYFRYMSDSGNYTIIKHSSYGFTKDTFEINEDERVSMTLLYKEKGHLENSPNFRAKLDNEK